MATEKSIGQPIYTHVGIGHKKHHVTRNVHGNADQKLLFILGISPGVQGFDRQTYGLGRLYRELVTAYRA